MAELKLNPEIFELKVTNHDLLKRAYTAYLANARSAQAKTKTRGDVRGGGKKPWRQKGTGRARFGSSRNPIWRGGGIAFGPTGEQNYKINISKNEKRLAVCQALSLQHEAKLISQVEFKTSGKTKDIAKLLDEQKADGNVLLVTANKTEELIRSTNNLANVKLVNAKYLNVFDLLNADAILIDKSGFDAIEAWLAVKPKTEDKEVANA